MNERKSKNSKEEQELIARALEIAITLTGAKTKHITRDDCDNIKIHDPLYSTFKMILTILNDNRILEYDNTRDVFKGFIVE